MLGSTPVEQCSLTRMGLGLYLKRVNYQPVFFEKHCCLGKATMGAVDYVEQFCRFGWIHTMDHDSSS